MFLPSATKARLILTVLIILLVFACKDDNVQRTESETSENTITIKVPGLSEQIQILHLTDTHISILDESEKEFHQYSKRMDEAYTERKHYKSGILASPAKHFSNLLKKIKSNPADLIVLTGDIINNPSPSSVSFVKNALDSTRIPYLYIAGNHDWHYEGMAGSLNSLRDEWVERSLKPLYNGRNPLYYQVDWQGIKIIALDNSTYQLNDAQFAFLKHELKKGLPTIVLVHIPFYHAGYSGSSVGTCGDPRWGYETDRNYEIERRERWPESGNLESTIKSVELIKHSNNIVAIFAGHKHQQRSDSFSKTSKQYITAAGIDGSHQIFNFFPEKD